MKLKISNIPLWMNSVELQRHFENFGQILSAILQFDAKGLSTGVVEIIFANDGATYAALTMHGAKIHGSIIQVELIS